MFADDEGNPYYCSVINIDYQLLFQLPGVGWSIEGSIENNTLRGVSSFSYIIQMGAEYLQKEFLLRILNQMRFLTDGKLSVPANMDVGNGEIAVTLCLTHATDYRRKDVGVEDSWGLVLTERRRIGSVEITTIVVVIVIIVIKISDGMRKNAERCCPRNGGRIVDWLPSTIWIF